jgi:hypothetical protein
MDWKTSINSWMELFRNCQKVDRLYSVGLAGVFGVLPTQEYDNFKSIILELVLWAFSILMKVFILDVGYPGSVCVFGRFLRRPSK